ncbi:MAG: CinA family protein, partial [Chloroflexi bacterium]|nr:CinA family protein [Chloroflexota bacterium]
VDLVRQVSAARDRGQKSVFPIGTFYIGIAGPDGLEEAERIETGATDRDANKRAAAQAAIDLLGKHLSAG